MANNFIGKKRWSGRSYDLGSMTFAELCRAYVTYPTICAYFVLGIASAVLAGITAVTAWGILLPIAAVVIAYPAVWYLLHRFVLHGRWLYKMKWSAALWKRIHFDHHQDPHLLEVLFGALYNTLPTIAIVTLPIGYAIGGWPGAFAAFATGMFTTCAYEFIHCIQHLNYKPRSPLIARMKRDHLAHHFHNENGNFGIVSFIPDHLLGTYYRTAKDRPKSASVFNLGYDVTEADRYPYVMDLTGAPPRDRPPSPREGRDAPRGPQPAL